MNNSLKLTFLTDEEKEFSFTVPNVRDDVENYISEVMDNIIAMDILDTKEKGSLVSKKSAVLKETELEDLNI